MLLRKSETQILDALWSSREPMSSAALLAAIPERKWKERSVFAILDSLLKKDLIYEAGFVRRGKTIARTFAPTMTYAEFIAQQVADSPHKPSLPSLVSAFLGSDGVTLKSLNELQEIIEQRKAELEDD